MEAPPDFTLQFQSLRRLVEIQSAQLMGPLMLLDSFSQSYAATHSLLDQILILGFKK